MRNRFFYLCLLIVACMSHIELMAQTNTINTYSPYTMYGLGELQSQGTLSTRSLGGAGVAARSVSSINLLNPASYSVSLQKGILFDFAIEGSSYGTAQKVDGNVQKGRYTTANIHDIALQVPLSKSIGLGFSVTPYSTVGYRQLKEYYEPAYGYVKMEYEGSGSVTEVKLGVGWEIMDGLSIGFAGQYYWGNIDREFSATISNITASGSAISPSGVDNISVSRIKGQAGIQAEIFNNLTTGRRMTAGFTLDLGGDLKPRYTRVISGKDRLEEVYAQNDTTTLSLVLPRQVAIGVEYATPKLLLAADFNYQGWANHNDVIEYSTDGMAIAYNNAATVKFGGQYTPHRGDVRHYYKRVSYRAGMRYGGYQYSFAGEDISQYAVTAGLGLPIYRVGISRIDVGLEWGRIGSLKNGVTVSGEQIGLIRQSYFKFSLGFTMFGDDYWFQRPQID